MKISYISWFIYVVIFGISRSITSAQISCPPSDGLCGGWTVVATTTLEVTQGCYADIDLQQRECNGVWQFRYTIASVSGECDFLTDFDLRQYHFSALKEFLDLEIILQSSVFGMVLPLCTNPDASKKKIIQMYSAACGVWIKCTYPVTSRQPLFCDVGLNPYELPDNTLDRWEFVSCGEACCMRTYEVCQDTQIGPDPGEIHITSHTTTQVGDCSLQSQFGNNTCLNGCEAP